MASDAPGFHLLETMRAANGVVALLDRHMERLGRSAAHFRFACNVDGVRQSIAQAAAQIETPAMLRLLVSADGAQQLEVRAMPEVHPRRVRLATVRVDSTDPFLHHKTTHRETYERARAGCGEDTDVLLVNERGEATETSIANIAILRDGIWITPPVACGLLPGTMRAELLARGDLQEGLIDAQTLVAGETIRCFNALRGIFDTAFER